MVKTKLFGEINSLRKDRQKLLEEVKQITPKQMDGFHSSSKDNDQLKGLRCILLEELKYVKGNRRNEISIHKAVLLNYMVNIYSKIQKRVNDDWHKLTETSKAKVFETINFYISHLTERKKKISKEEVDSFDLELKRLHRVIDLCLIESTPGFLTLQTFDPDVRRKVMEGYNRIREEVNSHRVFTDEADLNIGTILKELCTMLNTHISDEERVMVHKALFGSVHGTWRWYKCAGCGDVYCVANCGAVNQIARCRKCGSTIGDHSRVANPDMQRALNRGR